ncbi:hypothetical protein [Halarcobacter anaerophilus]|jgi:Spy/CpxP family protein refolding chaperone|uniref:hypothetical protein n=1 Tax=Halarcobacter anaerophilus TaxID=877500 RepID=UPI0005C88431|nr:hypothetical protein [Halarcobacter anaerophilus]
MKKFILTIGLTALVTSSTVFAFGGSNRDSNCGSYKMMNKPYVNYQNNSMHKIMSIISNINLTQEQWIELKKTMLDMKKERLDDKLDMPTITFDKNGSFDKEKFVNERTTFSKNMIEAQSKMIEKVVSILDESQRKFLVTELNDSKFFEQGKFNPHMKNAGGCRLWN